ncbi:class I SAM-dependent methyltransferase [Azospirillum sp. TSO5]|uniref:class I SAM-dependent methyltransferase n=1 Tax=Azospirillum sp. TSO5 TaxID=716760 RepID=UPI0018EEC304|nr:class I SAM-dependent methyltransferase [Azospirillum sp. TSO5]
MTNGQNRISGSDKTVARDPVNQELFELADRSGLARFGIMNNHVWHHDPKRLVFTLARYKFVAKMLAGRSKVVEYGCGDAFCSRLVRQEVDDLTVTDFDAAFIADAKARMEPPWAFEAREHDIIAGPLDGLFDAAYALDVLEHIEADMEDRVLANITASLTEHGVAIIGMPSLESQAYASPQSKAGHVNCKTGEGLRTTMLRHFHNVFMFSMNDEVVHTGFFPMAHYLLAIGCTKRTAFDGSGA